jgi:hypothetical protein
VDGGMTPALLTLRQVALQLSPTDRAKNELQLSGRMDLSHTNAYSGALTLRAESLDVTPYYDLMGKRSTNTAPPAGSTPPSGVPGPVVEPEALVFPLQDLKVDARIDRLYLHELAVSNWLANATVNGGRIRVATNQLTLNGAPVSLRADLDLGVKGWTYDVALRADKVPLEPLANTFSPDTRGQYQGLLLCDAQVKGAGITDAGIRSNLAARIDFSFTNAIIQLSGAKARALLVPVSTLLRLPELQHSPLNWVWVQSDARNGAIRLTRAEVQSAAFEARTEGAIPLATVLTNSPLNLPVEFALRRFLAEKAGLMTALPARNTNYVTLPQFATVKGTLGQPKSDLNAPVISGLLLKSGVALAESLGVKVAPQTGDLLKGLGNLLTGDKPASAATNQTTVPPASTTTNLNATTNRSTATNAPLNLLDLLRPQPSKR